MTVNAEYFFMEDLHVTNNGFPLPIRLLEDF